MRGGGPKLTHVRKESDVGEADKILAEVERRKKKANEIGLPKIILGFYRDFARGYPHWKGDDRSYIPKQIVDAQKVGTDGVRLTIDEKIYEFQWSQRSSSAPDSDSSIGNLKLLLSDRLVFEIMAIGQYDEWGSSWSPARVEAFVEGPWVTTFTELAKEAKEVRDRASEVAAKRKREDPAALAELRKRFGISAVEAEAKCAVADKPEQPKPEQPEPPKQESPAPKMEYTNIPEPEWTKSWWKRLIGG